MKRIDIRKPKTITIASERFLITTISSIFCVTHINFIIPFIQTLSNKKTKPTLSSSFDLTQDEP